MAKVTITNPQPSRCTINRRGCGWGNATTVCRKCGRIIIGHNRGLCSRCTALPPFMCGAACESKTFAGRNGYAMAMMNRREMELAQERNGRAGK